MVGQYFHIIFSTSAIINLNKIVEEQSELIFFIDLKWN